ncbi:hypothetical protein PQQ51_32630 [Paraburkholderia xenovorans]|uniref:hypothetical protein n=1 Tax=Paraburkholderia xenovorans TaxID=36873 RepID=UPI0038B9D901
MNSLIKAVAVALVLGAPLASFAQAMDQYAPPARTRADNAQVSQGRVAAQKGNADSSGYGPNGHGSWQAGNSSDTTVSSYSPPIYNMR